MIITLLGYFFSWFSSFQTNVSLLILLLSVLLTYCYLHSLQHSLSITVALLTLVKFFSKYFIFNSKIMKKFFEKCSKITIKTRSLLMKFIQQIPRVKLNFFRCIYKIMVGRKTTKLQILLSSKVPKRYKHNSFFGDLQKIKRASEKFNA